MGDHNLTGTYGRGLMSLVITGLLGLSFGCGNRNQVSSVEASVKQPEPTTSAEPKSGESKSVDPQVQSEIDKAESEKRATLLKDAQSAIDETRNAVAALDKGDKDAALQALSRVTGKLDLVISRDPKLALAPVAVSTTIFDLYTNADTVKTVVKQAKDDLSSNQVQQARSLLTYLASEADIHVTELPLATYPGAIKAVAPLIDAGKIDEAKAALVTVLNTLAIETYIIPLPQVRAEAMLAVADSLAAKNGRTPDDNTKVRALIDGARNEIKFAEALGYGTKDDYKPLYAQLDDVQKKIDGGQSGKGLFGKLRQSIKNFKFAS
ncbi:MAG: hypothetical protein QOG67_3716 [Verrucomicrobiota bacterium]